MATIFKVTPAGLEKKRGGSLHAYEATDGADKFCLRMGHEDYGYIIRLTYDELRKLKPKIDAYLDAPQS